MIYGEAALSARRTTVRDRITTAGDYIHAAATLCQDQTEQGTTVMCPEIREDLRALATDIFALLGDERTFKVIK